MAVRRATNALTHINASKPRTSISVFLVMALYSLNICSRDGEVLDTRRVTACGVHAALVKANRRFHQLVTRPLDAMDPQGHIDVTDLEGRTVARLVLAESFAAMR
jgi:hypothetical protein